MTQPIDTAYVDIVARDKSLSKMERDIDRAMKKIDKNFERDLKKIDKDFDDAFAEIDKHFSDMEKTAQKNFDELEKIVDESFTDIDERIGESRRKTRKHFQDTVGDADDAFDGIQSRFTNPLSRAFNGLTDIVKNVGQTLGQIGGAIGGFATSFPLLVLIAVLTPAIISLAAALAQLIGVVALVPASLGVLLAAILPLVFAFQNFGEAVSAVASGDLEKIDEALKKLSPSAAFVAREIGRMMPLFREFQKSIQEAFFSKVLSDMTHFAMVVLPVFKDGMIDVAQALGGLVHEFAVWMRQGTNLLEFQELFASTARIIEQLTGPFVRFTDALLRITVHALPFVEKLSQGFGNLLDRFSAFLQRSTQDGSFDKFLQDALDTIKELVDLLKAVGGLIGTIFAGTEQAGHDFIVQLTIMIKRLDEFFKTADGKMVLETLVFLTKVLTESIRGLLTLFANTVIIIRQVLQFLNDLGEGFVGLVQKIGEWLSKVPGIIFTFIGSIPQRLGALLSATFDAILQNIGMVIGLIMFNVTQLPQLIMDTLRSLPAQAYDALIDFGLRVSEALNGAMIRAKEIVVTGFQDILRFILSVPDRIRELVPSFDSAGSNLIQSFMNGFRRVGNFVGDVAGDIVGAVRGFLNRAIDKINNGIAIVDDVLPGSLGRIPRLAQGAFVPARPGGILANVGEGGEDEWVLPDSKLRALAEGQSITFGPGAINVNFSGVVPTEDEARTTGAAIGRGILDILDRQNARVQVRAV